jgi:thiol:disulfide interchange protein DsbC
MITMSVFFLSGFSRLRAFLSRRVPIIALALMLCGIAPMAAAADADPAPQIKAAVEMWLQGRYKVENMRRSPVAGIWEVQVNTDLIYVDEKAMHAFVEGQLIDLKTSRNLTQERVDELTAIQFKDLPLAIAIKQVNGKGTRRIAVFEDPNCGYCRSLRKDLVSVPDVTIYTFTLPILSADSELKVRQAWCASDKSKAWNDLMISGKVPDNKGACTTPVDKITELGRKLKITGTPTIFFNNGKRVPGGIPVDRLNKLLEENS